MSAAGGLVKMVENAAKIGVNTFQFFTRNPRGSSYRTPDRCV